jgi:hypothetical protein
MKANLAAQKEFGLVRNEYLTIDPRCQYCWDTGLWMPAGRVSVCPDLTLPSHVISSIRANIIAREATRVQDLCKHLNENEFDIARFLTHFEKDTPCPREKLDYLLHGKITLQTARAVMKLIEILRSLWMLPVGSSRVPPAGYWIITESKEYERWFDHALQASRTQFAKFYRNARHNYPHFASQLSFNFFEREVDHEF